MRGDIVAMKNSSNINKDFLEEKLQVTMEKTIRFITKYCIWGFENS